MIKVYLLIVVWSGIGGTMRFDPDNVYITRKQCEERIDHLRDVFGDQIVTSRCQGFDLKGEAP